MTTEINANFNERVIVHSEHLEWADSPIPGVARRPLDRVGGEVARATTIVRYEPNSEFSPHVHTGGEEIIVIEGVFQDEHGDFPVGSYIRNPPQSSHTPKSEPGCVIFVKLWQFEPEDRTHVRLNTHYMKPVPHRDINGVCVTPLYIDEQEEVSIHDWQANTDIVLEGHNGMEVFVLDGEFTERGDVLVKHSWLRLPKGSILRARSGNQGAKVWIKQNHLPYVDAQIERIKSQ